ncbi:MULTISPECIES: VOC family protein [Legionella]|uniref:Glyoxalase/bleomycin resistance protein n=1 Tax=Legionella drozanskii LLAP-1 TaxID=1212489 RepID=A0A0W0SMD6_9GAMM|nr:MULTISPECIES: VOC family protein [Legionella]KTC84570.1 glyoxalase/bleomycin resistance protein [Legionella drozanskii LLAP-1]PJE18363.1 MAG: VOC family protein [Legionella sp.]
MNRPKQGEFCWNELATTNIKAAKDFYGKLLGWKFIEHEAGDMTYTMINAGEHEFGGIWQIPTEQKDQIPPHWMGYILVDDIEQTLEKAKSLGATIKMPVTPVGDMGRFIVVVDPTGAHIAFWESKEK